MRKNYWPVAFVIVWTALVSGKATAQTADNSAIDKLVYDALKDMHNKAADLYNSGDSNGCYRMFQGGLTMTRPFLAHRPDVQQILDQGMQSAEKMPSVPQRARILHDTIEQVRTRIKPPSPIKSSEPPPINPLPPAPTPNPMPPAPATNPTSQPPMPPTAATDTLWKRLGGEDGVSKIVDTFLAQALVDVRVNFTRGDRFKFDKQKEADLKHKLVAYISSITDGTVVPTSSRSLAEAHKGMNITGAEFDAFVRCLKSAMETNNVAAPDVEAVLTKIRATRKDIAAGE